MKIDRRGVLSRLAWLLAAAMPLQAAAPKSAEYHRLGVTLAADKTMNMVLPDGAMLSGLVKDVNGNPVKGSYVGAVLTEGIVPAVGGFTDSTGAFSFPVQPGTYEVRASSPISTSWSPSTFSHLLPSDLQSVSVPGNMSIGTLLLPNGSILSGKLLPPSGTFGLFSGALWTIPTSGDIQAIRGAQFSTTAPGQYAVALPNGTYKVRALPILGYSSSFEVIPASLATSTVSITGDKTLNLKLKKGYHLTGSVTESAKRKLDGGLFIFQRGSPFIQAFFVGWGLVVGGVIDMYLPSGSFNAVFVPVLDTTYTGRAIRTGINFTMPAGNMTLNIPVADGVILSGKLTDAKKKVVKSATIIVRESDDPLGPLHAIFGGDGYTNSKGQYRAVVSAGTYDIIAYPTTSEPAALGETAGGLMNELRQQLQQAHRVRHRNSRMPTLLRSS